MTDSTSFDAVVVGAGQAGPPLAARLANAGLKTVLIEREHLGGTCVNDGCTPTKALVASARAAHMARRAADYGVRLEGTVGVDMKAVKARMDAVVGHSVANLEKWLGGTPNLTLLWGHARFTGPRRLEVGGRAVEAPKVFLDVGARAAPLPWHGAEGVEVLSNASLLALDALPDHLVIAGGSYIGLEFAQIYRRFGARVTVVEHGERLISREDADVSDAIRSILEGEGVAFHFSAKQAGVAPGPGGAGVRVSLAGRGAGGGALDIDASHLLAAVGRMPNTDDLGLDAAGIETDERGHVVVDDELRTSAEGVWALGEANGRGAFTHTSYNDFQIVAANLLDGGRRRVSERIPAYALYTDPPLGRIGMGEAEVRASGRPALVGTLPMARVSRARERGETDGFMRVFVDAENERILGATLLGIEADEVVHLLLDAMYAGASYKVVRDAVHIHPTVSELIPTLLEDLQPLAPAGGD